MTIFPRLARTWPATTAAVGVITVALSGCANVSESAGSATPATNVAVKAGSAMALALPASPKFVQAPASERAALPIDSYELSPARQDLLADAQLKTQAQCMSGLGLAMQVTYSRSVPTSDPRLRRYGITDLQLAQQFGYHLPPSARISATSNDRSTMSLSGQQVALLKGTVATAPNGKAVPAGGCAAVAAKRMGLGVPGQGPEDQQTATALGSVSRIDEDGFQKSLASAATTPILADWAGCMARSGYHFRSPIDAAGSVDLSTAAASRAEIQQAVTDVRCKQSTNLVRRWAAVEAPIERAELRSASAQLAGYQSRLKAQLSAAAAVLAVSVPS